MWIRKWIWLIDYVDSKNLNQICCSLWLCKLVSFVRLYEKYYNNVNYVTMNNKIKWKQGWVKRVKFVQSGLCFRENQVWKFVKHTCNQLASMQLNAFDVQIDYPTRSFDNEDQLNDKVYPSAKVIVNSQLLSTECNWWTISFINQVYMNIRQF